MKEVLNKIWTPLNTYWKGLDRKKSIGIIAIALVVLTSIVIASILMTQKEYVVLYENMEQQEAGEILTKLEEMKVDAKPKGNNTILVPEDQADTLRMQLSAEGYPKSTLNYDIFENSSNFGASDFEKQKYLQFQLQERLQNAIKTLDIVEDAIVTLNIPDNSSFVLKEDKQKASASVILKLKSKEALSKEQIKGIEGLVSKSVPGLSAEEVFIIDSMGNSLKSNSNSQADIAGEQLQLEASMSDKLENEIVSLLEPVFGAGNISAGVRVALDFDQRTTESLRYDPIEGENQGITVSESIESEILDNGTEAGNVGLDSNGGATQYAETDDQAGQYRKENKTTNYEVDQIRETVKSAEGKIKDISVSVLLNEKDLQSGAVPKVKDIVSGALGIDKEKIVVEQIAFNAKDEIDEMFNNSQQTTDAVKRHQRNTLIFTICGISVLILLVVFLFVYREIRKRRAENEEELLLPDTTGRDEEEEQQVEMEIQRSEKRRVIENSIDRKPELVALLLRNWLKDDEN